MLHLEKMRYLCVANQCFNLSSTVYINSGKLNLMLPVVHIEIILNIKKFTDILEFNLNLLVAGKN